MRFDLMIPDTARAARRGRCFSCFVPILAFVVVAMLITSLRAQTLSVVEADQIPALPVMVGVRVDGEVRGTTLTALDVGRARDVVTWGASVSGGALLHDGRVVGRVTWEQEPERDGLWCRVAIRAAEGELLPERLLLEVLVPELPGVRHDWLLFDEVGVRTGVFGERGDQASDGGDDSGLMAAERVAVRTNTDGYIALDRVRGVLGVERFADERTDRPTFCVQLLLEDADEGGEVEAAFRLRHRAYEDVLREKDASYATMYPSRDRYASRGVASIEGVSLSSDRVERYGALTVKVDCQGDWINPFDPEDVTLDAVVLMPSGREVTVPGFLNEGYRFRYEGGVEHLEREGDPWWEIRYAPVETGAHRIRVILNDGSGKVVSEALPFEVTEGESHGFVRVSERSPRYFEHDDGSLYFPIGLNVGWSDRSGQKDFERYFEGIAGADGNFARVWLGPTFTRLGLERGIVPGHPGANGLGWVDLKAAARVDEVFRLADRLDMKLMVAIESFSAMRDSGEPRHWHESPYNVALGGPIRRTGEMLSDPVAKGYFKQRLRYLVARYGHYTALMNWELWNEVNGIDGYDSSASAVWHAEMAKVIKRLDVYEHPVATSFWINHGDRAVDELEDLDFNQTHVYGVRDFPTYFVPIAQRKIARYQKPHLFGEYGVHVHASGSTGVDLEGVQIDNGHWAALLSGSAGGPMLWWWDNYVEPNDLYGRMTPLARFVEGMPLHVIPSRPLEKVSLRREGGGRAAEGPYRPLLITPAARSWDRCDVNVRRTFEVSDDGRVSDFDVLPAVVHGREGDNRGLHNAPTFSLTMPEDGRFTVHVETVSGWSGAGLEIRVDDEVRLLKDFPDNNGSSRAEIKSYNGAYSVELSAGEHLVTVDNPGEDWMAVRYEVTDYLPSDHLNVDVWARGFVEPDSEGLVAFVWLRDRDYTWSLDREAHPDALAPIRDCVLRVPVVHDGAYLIEWWDTREGAVMGSTETRSSDGVLDVAVPTFERSVAAKVYLKQVGDGG